MTSGQDEESRSQTLDYLKWLKNIYKNQFYDFNLNDCNPGPGNA